MSELLNCPFCGEEAEVIEIYVKGSANTKHFFVRCKKCRARHGNNTFASREKARQHWNTRADDWINVKEGLPEVEKMVLLFSKYGMVR